MRYGFELGEQFGHPYGLGDVFVHAGGQEAFAVAEQGVGGEGDDRDVFSGLGLGSPDPFGRLDPVHLGHLNIHEYEVVSAAFQDGQGLAAVVGRIDAVAHLAEQPRDDLLAERVVFDEEDFPRHAGFKVGDFFFGLDIRYGGGAESYREIEGAAPVYFAFYPYLPAHHFHQPLGDGQPQAGTAETPRYRAVDLAEGFEELVHVGGGDADAGVGDGEDELGDVAGQADRFERQRDGAFFGEFYAVVDEVVEDLAQAVAGPAHDGGDGAGHFGFEDEPFAGGMGGVGFDYFVDEFADGEVAAVDGQFADFHFGEVEDVVDEQQQ